MKGMDQEKHIVADLINPGDFIVLVVPIDSAAPKGRLILPQQQVLRDILDAGAMAVVTRESELEQTLQGLAKNPALVITDSQVFQTVAAIVPKDIKLTSFSVLTVTLLYSYIITLIILYVKCYFKIIFTKINIYKT